MLRGDIAVSHWPLPLQAPCARRTERACMQRSISRVFTFPRIHWTSSRILDGAGVGGNCEPIPRTHAPFCAQASSGFRPMLYKTEKNPLWYSSRYILAFRCPQCACTPIEGSPARTCACVNGPMHRRRPLTNRTDEPGPFRVQSNRQ